MAWRQWAGTALAIALFAALLIAAIPRYRDGLATDAAIPVPTSMTAQIPLPPAAYQSAVNALWNANPANARASNARGEALLHLGAYDAAAQGLAAGISHAPASIRAWVILAEALRPAHPREAASILSQAMVIAPFDFWIIGQRLADASGQWDMLDKDASRQALEQTRLLWKEPILHPQLLTLLASPAGIKLVTAAFANDPQGLRDMNRWVSQQARRHAVSTLNE